MRILLILILLVFTKCTMERDELRNVDYLNKKHFFPKIFTSHFPEKINTSNENAFHFVTDSNSSLEISFMLVENVDWQNLYLDSLISVSVASYSSLDTNLFIINAFHNDENYFDRIKELNEVQMDYVKKHSVLNYLPVPNFFITKYRDNKEVNKLKDGFQLFVLEAESGEFWDKKYLKKGISMPKKWKHGISRGVAINKSEGIAIYWFQIW